MLDAPEMLGPRLTKRDLTCGSNKMRQLMPSALKAGIIIFSHVQPVDAVDVGRRDPVVFREYNAVCFFYAMFSKMDTFVRWNLSRLTKFGWL